MSVPRHVAFVPDGNRRWARARGLGPGDGHRAGIANVGRVVDAAFSSGIEVCTFWWGSPANLTRRAPGEVEAIVGVLSDWLLAEAPAVLARHGAGFTALGRWPELAPRLAPAIASASAAPRRQHELVLLMAYDGREEILDAARRGAVSSVEDFGASLWTGGLPPVDLVVRTGGEPHLSAGFLLWGIAEAQLAFPAMAWPDFSGADLDAVLAAYAATERRLGS